MQLDSSVCARNQLMGLHLLPSSGMSYYDRPVIASR